MSDADIDRLRLRGFTVVEKHGAVDVTGRDGRFIGRFGPDNVSPVAESDKVHKRRPGRSVTPPDVLLKKSRRVNRPK